MIKINMNYDLITCPIKRPNIIVENDISFHHRRIVLYDSWETVMQMNQSSHVISRSARTMNSQRSFDVCGNTAVLKLFLLVY